MLNNRRRMRLTILTSYFALKKIICYLFKRTEGELNRLLAIFPNNQEALTLLDRLRKK
ncbi:MAG: hypothetical protein M3367_08430 [Acidobacteriota bacterium]|nr:hypothetical protein [Acidobacteriota bacterium]